MLRGSSRAAPVSRCLTCSILTRLSHTHCPCGTPPRPVSLSTDCRRLQWSRPRTCAWRGSSVAWRISIHQWKGICALRSSHLTDMSFVPCFRVVSCRVVSCRVVSCRVVCVHVALHWVCLVTSSYVVMAVGLRNRRTASHNLNHHSSRGHCMLTVHIDSVPAGGPSPPPSRQGKPRTGAPEHATYVCSWLLGLGCRGVEWSRVPCCCSRVSRSTEPQ